MSASIGFAAVFGQRGTASHDRLDAAVPSQHARADLAELLAQVADGDVSASLMVLKAYGQDRPLIACLRDAVCERMLADVMRIRRESTRRRLGAMYLRDKYSERIVRIESEGHSRMHLTIAPHVRLWCGGFAPDEQTVCGISLHAAERTSQMEVKGMLLRGCWTGLRDRCLTCASAADGVDDCFEDRDDWPVFSQEMFAQMHALLLVQTVMALDRVLAGNPVAGRYSPWDAQSDLLLERYDAALQELEPGWCAQRSDALARMFLHGEYWDLHNELLPAGPSREEFVLGELLDEEHWRRLLAREGAPARLTDRQFRSCGQFGRAPDGQMRSELGYLIREQLLTARHPQSRKATARRRAVQPA